VCLRGLIGPGSAPQRVKGIDFLSGLGWEEHYYVIIREYGNYQSVLNVQPKPARIAEGLIKTGVK
jgi:hypothetical protein